MTIVTEAQFSIGDVVNHKLFGYRGVIVDVDPSFVGTDAWYESVASSRPPKDQPWYHVLPHGGRHQTYVAERNLENDPTGMPVEHPLVPFQFLGWKAGRYTSRRAMN
jgi:heat shock protein HspQ